MEREYVKEDFVWKRLDCENAMVNHLGRLLRPWMDGRDSQVFTLTLTGVTRCKCIPTHNSRPSSAAEIDHFQAHCVPTWAMTGDLRPGTREACPLSSHSIASGTASRATEC